MQRSSISHSLTQLLSNELVIVIYLSDQGVHCVSYGINNTLLCPSQFSQSVSQSASRTVVDFEL